MKLQRYKTRQIFKQFFFRFKYFSIYLLYLILKFLLLNKYIQPQTKAVILFYFAQINKNFFKTRHKNICLVSGHKRSVINFFKMNRLSALEHINSLELPGVKSSIW